MDKRNVSIVTSISSDGIGVPSVSIYFSYCDRVDYGMKFCDGCHNKELQEDGYGERLSYEDIIYQVGNKLKYLKELTNMQTCIAFVGGEPLADINKYMVARISEYFKDTPQILYTWRDSSFISNEDIAFIDRVVCGEYMKNKRVDDYLLGSSNQYIINNKKEVILKYGGTK